MMNLLNQERLKYEIYPPKKLVFKALELCPIDKARVVILGQDPYHKKGQAHGLAFSVTNDQKPPPSLRNILKEVQSDVGRSRPEETDLTPWAKQGVLLLNTSLTVRKGAPGSHAKIGWKYFTQSILKRVAARRSPVVFILWGAHAQKAGAFLCHNNYKRHIILKAAHPSPLSSKGFFGCKHFSKTNNFLVSLKEESIEW
jgi:uracil-DNA glycosylase